MPSSLRLVDRCSTIFVLRQNARNIWGTYFPLFNDKETRLYELDEIERILEKTPSLQIQSSKYFQYGRVSELEWLLEQARNRHYSTFSLYSKGEFEEAIAGFEQSIKEHFRDPKNITWVDENVLLVVRKVSS